MNILWVATKAPWPPVDGGRLLMDLTLRALGDAGHRVTVVAPVRDRPPGPAPAGLQLVTVPDPFRPKALDLLSSWPRGRSFSLARHRSRPVAAKIRRLLDEQRFDVIHAEQVQALSLLPALRSDDPPVALRTQNVESDLWRLLADHRPLVGPLLKAEAHLLAREEGKAVRSCAAACALTPEDAERLGKLGRSPALPVIPPPFPDSQPAAERTLPGDPAVVILGGAGWLPNLLGARWFVGQIWPAVAERLPGARLHVFGDLPEEVSRDRVEIHPSPVDGRDAFAPGSILVVPLHVASGIRMKILEAWSRGVAVVATPVAARGLGAVDGEHLHEAQDPDSFERAIGHLARPEAYGAVVDAARRRLREHHDPGAIARRCLELYGEAGAKGSDRAADSAAASMSRVASSSEDSA